MVGDHADGRHAGRVIHRAPLRHLERRPGGTRRVRRGDDDELCREQRSDRRMDVLGAGPNGILDGCRGGTERDHHGGNFVARPRFERPDQPVAGDRDRCDRQLPGSGNPHLPSRFAFRTCARRDAVDRDGQCIDSGQRDSAGGHVERTAQHLRRRFRGFVRRRGDRHRRRPEAAVDADARCRRQRQGRSGDGRVRRRPRRLLGGNRPVDVDQRAVRRVADVGHRQRCHGNVDHRRRARGGEHRRRDVPSRTRGERGRHPRRAGASVVLRCHRSDGRGRTGPCVVDDAGRQPQRQGRPVDRDVQ